MRTIQTVTESYKEKALELVEQVFSDHYDPREGRAVRALVSEIRSKKYYIPELELMAADENGEIIGYAMFSRFHIEGRYEDELLILTPVAVKTELQRQHISKDIIEYGLIKAKEMGFKAVLVEGDPANYNPRGFVTAADHGILPGKTVQLPRIECLMVCGLAPDALDNIHGIVDYSFYSSLCGDTD